MLDPYEGSLSPFEAIKILDPYKGSFPSFEAIKILDPYKDPCRPLRL